MAVLLLLLMFVVCIAFGFLCGSVVVAIAASFLYARDS